MSTSRPARSTRDPRDELQAHLRDQQLVSGVLTHIVQLPAEELDRGVDESLAHLGAWLDVDRVYVFAIHDELTFNTHEWCAHGVAPQIHELQSLPLETVAAWLPELRAGRPVVVADVARLPEERLEERELLSAQGIRSLLVVPMLSFGELIGFVGFDACATARDFSASEQVLLRSVTDVLSAALVRREAANAIAAGQRAAEEALREQALTDPLTGLPNRLLLRDRLERACERARRSEDLVAVVLLDVDGFKLVNDGRGHGVGDALLCKIGERLATSLRGGDTAARFGGDEFVLVLEGLPDEQAVFRAVDRLRLDLLAPLVVEDVELRLTASFGVAVHDGSGPADVDELLLDADTAMYAAKERGRNRVVMFDAPMRSRAVRREQLATRLRGAVANGDVDVAFQPLVDLRTGRILGAEALARWRDSQLGPVSPAEFIPLAEETGLVSDLGRSVLRAACRVAATWPTELSLSVNLSRQQLVDVGLAAEVAGIVAEEGFTLDRLEVEVTESTVMHAPEVAARVLNDLRARGARVAIDDFGTGHSSLAMLRDLPVDRLKIDRSFVARIVREERDFRLVRAIVGVAEDLDLEVLAEGVETTDQRLLLQALRIPAAQGWLFGRAVAADEFAAMTAIGHLPVGDGLIAA